MSKVKKIMMSKEEFKEEHKRLIHRLKSKSHKDDLKEAKSQEREMKHYGIKA